MGMVVFLQIMLLTLINSLGWAFDAKEAAIKDKIEKANYCQATDDCKIVGFGCPFGCGSYINKKEEAGLMSAVTSYIGNQPRCVYDCMRGADPQCVAGRCVPAECEIGRFYDPLQCVCPADALIMNPPYECVRKTDVFVKMAALDGDHTPDEMKDVITSIAKICSNAVSAEFAVSITNEWLRIKSVKLYEFLTGLKNYLIAHPFGGSAQGVIDDFVKEVSSSQRGK